MRIKLNAKKWKSWKDINIMWSVKKYKNLDEFTEIQIEIIRKKSWFIS